MMNALNATVTTLRNIARDGLRMKLINARRTRITELNVDKDAVNKRITDLKLDLAVAEYEKAHIPTDHPMKDQKAKSYDSDIEYVTKNIKECEEELTELDKRIKEQDEGIAKIESGETKVSREELEAETSRLVKVVSDKTAASVSVDAAPAPAPAAPKKG